MIDWMVQVLHILNEPSWTFFSAVQIMDSFFMATHETLTPEKLHLIGVASIRIACKYEELAVIPIEEFADQLTKGKFTPK